MRYFKVYPTPYSQEDQLLGYYCGTVESVLEDVKFNHPEVNIDEVQLYEISEKFFYWEINRNLYLI